MYNVHNYIKKAGGNNNPLGLGGKSGKTKDNNFVNLYNIQVDKKAPTGTSKQAGLRRLRKDRPDLHLK